MTRIRVPPRDVRVALDNARARDEMHRERQSYRERVAKRDRHPEVDNFIGVIGEVAFSIYADVKYDVSLSTTGDSGADFLLRRDGEEQTVDMKTRTGDVFTFWVKEYKLDADWYVLGDLDTPIDDLDDHTIDSIDTLEGWEVQLRGMASKSQFQEARRIESDYGWTNRSVPLDELRPLPDPENVLAAR